MALYQTVRLILWQGYFLFCSSICAENSEPMVFLESCARQNFCFFQVMESTGMWLNLAHSWKITYSRVVWVSTRRLTSLPPGQRMLKRYLFCSTPYSLNFTSSSSSSSYLIIDKQQQGVAPIIMHDHYRDLMNYSRASIGYLSLVYFAMASFSNPFTLSKLNHKLLSDCSQLSAASSSLMFTQFSGLKPTSCLLKRGMETFLDVGCTEKGNLSRWFCMVETWWSMRGQRKESMIYSSTKVKRCTLASGSLPRAQSLGVLDISNLSISSVMRPNITSLLLYLLRFQASLTLSFSFQCLAARILSIKSMHFWFLKFLVSSSILNTSCSCIISSKWLRRMLRLRYTCALVQFLRQYSLMSALSTSSLPFDRQAMLSTIPTTLSASKDSALTLPVTSSRQSTSPFLTESLSWRARLSLTQICSPLPPENTNMSCSKPKSYRRAFSMISTAVTSSFQHLVHTLFPSQHVRTSSQSFMSKSKISSLSRVLAFESFSGVRFQTAPASTLRGVASLELLELAIILFLKALASTKVTYLSTTLPSNSKESSRWAS